MPTRGLYAITGGQTGPALTARVAGYLRGGARLVQYRDKSADHTRRESDARALLGLCREAGVPLLINDDIALAARIGAAGVHLGEDDADIAGARRQLGSTAIIGASCYNRLERARTALGEGADYVAFGSLFPSPTKPAAVRARPSLLTQARRELPCPIVAIGGITPDNGATVLAAGADLLAVIGGLETRRDPEQAARVYSEMFTSTTSEEMPRP